MLTDVMELYIIELPKFEKYKEKTNNNTLNSWVKFIENPEVIDMGEANEKIKKSKEVLEEISSDERERYLAELREKYIMDQKAIEDAGYDKGLEQGMQQGMQLGKEQAILEIAKVMKRQNVDLKIITQATGLTEQEIKKLK